MLCQSVDVRLCGGLGLLSCLLSFTGALRVEALLIGFTGAPCLAGLALGFCLTHLVTSLAAM